MKKIIFIFEVLDFERACSYILDLVKLNGTENLTVVTNDFAINLKLEKEGLSVKKFDELVAVKDFKYRVFKKSCKLFELVSSSIKKNNKHLCDFNDLNFWEINKEAIIRASIMPGLLNVVYVNDIIKNISPDVVYCLDTDDKNFKVISEISKRLKFKVFFKDVSLNNFSAKFRNLLNRTIKKVVEPFRQIKRYDYLFFGLIYNTFVSPFDKSYKIIMKQNGKKVLFMGCVKRYFESVRPVIMSCREKSLTHYVIDMKNFSIASTLKKKEIPFAKLAWLINFKLFFEIIVLKRVVKRNLNELMNSKDFKRSFVYEGIPLWHIFFEYMHVMFFTILNEQVETIVLFESLFKKSKPKLLVTVMELRFISELFLKYNVPTLLIQSAGIKDCYWGEALTVEKIAVDGEYSKNQLVRNGNDEKNIVLTGQPRFDSYLDHKNSMKRKRDEFYAKYNILRTKKLFFFPSSYFMDGNRRSWLSDLYSSIKDFDEIQLVTKLHPYEFDMQLHSDIAMDVGLLNLILLDDSTNVMDVVLASDCIITYRSTVGYDAALFNIPVISYHFNEWWLDSFGYSSSKAIITIKNKEELKEALNKLIHDKLFLDSIKKELKDFVNTRNYKLDGKSSDRILNLIESMI